MKNITIILISCLLLLSIFSSCEKDSNTDNSTSSNNTTKEGVIYYKWTNNYNNCEPFAIPTQDIFTTNHPDIPDHAEENTYYKNVEPGSFTLDMTSGGGGSYEITLEKPEEGYIRYYTHLLKYYNSGLNRCVYNPKLTYEDKPM